MAKSSPPTESSGKSGKGKLMLIVGGVVALAALGGGGFVAGNMLGAKNAPAAHAAPPPPVVPAPIFVPLDAFTINLKGSDGERFLHTGLSVKVADADSQARLAQYQPEARSRVLLLLSARQPEDLATVEGKQKLADDVKQALARPFAAGLPPQQITDVLFTSFVVQ